MGITTVFGLPAHPLFVRAPLVLVPLAVLGGASVLIGIFAVVWVVRTGHSGADAVWHGTKVVVVEREEH